MYKGIPVLFGNQFPQTVLFASLSIDIQRKILYGSSGFHNRLDQPVDMLLSCQPGSRDQGMLYPVPIRIFQFLQAAHWDCHHIGPNSHVLLKLLFH